MNAADPRFYDAGHLLALASCFAIPAQPKSVTPLGRGLVNATFSVATDAGDYVLQRVNGTVFPEPERIMDNLRVVGAHLARYPESGLSIPVPILHRSGASFTRDHQGNLWRLMPHIAHGVNLPRIDTAEQAGEVGHALGYFHRLLADLDPAGLAVTLPGFHVTPAYLAHLDQVLEERPLDRTEADLDQALAAVARGRPWVGALEQARRDGRIAPRVTHGDPKLDNILFHETNGRALGVIDLDTVQPGLIAHDIGDCLRSCCNRQGESGDGSAGFDLDIGRPILVAYAGEMRGLLSAGEVATLFDGIRILPYELGVRFLTDHLEGDRYFRVQARGENLHKALIQFALGADIERQEVPIRALIAEVFHGD
jgi:Ser/Thr protein kinase RdoA (MazF antagonist)